MTRRDAALLSLTLAGLYCLVECASLAMRFLLLAASMPRGGRGEAMFPLLFLTCLGVTLIHSRRKLSTWIFGANPSLDATAVVNAGDVRLLTVRLLGIVALMHLTASFGTSGLALGAVVAALCWLGPRFVASLLFAAGIGSGRSVDGRDAFAVVGAWFALGALPALVRTPRDVANIAVLVAGLALFLGARFVKSAA